MSGKQKLYFLLNRIADVREITLFSQPLKIDPTNDLNRKYTDIELEQLFAKLENDEQVLRVLKVPSRIKTIDIVEDLDPYDHADDGCWHIELLPAFDNYYWQIQQESEYQKYTGKVPESKPVSVGNGNLMSYEEKLDLIVKALIEARKATGKGQSTILFLNATNGLDKLNREEILVILAHLEDKSILKAESRTNRLLPLNKQPPNPNFIFVNILEGFDDWYTNYLTVKKSKIKNLSRTNFVGICSILHQINGAFELASSPEVNLNFIESHHDIEGYEHADIVELQEDYFRKLGYLKQIGVLKDYSYGKNDFFSNLLLDVPKFLEVYEEACQLETQKNEKEKPAQFQDNPQQPTPALIPIIQTTGNGYKITYTKAREIVLNDEYLLAKPDFDSENDLVFSFLFQHSNEKFTIKQIEEAIKQPLNKTLHKIVENLGFQGDLKKMFFDVSSDTICFRNPLSRSEFEKLGIGRIKFPR